jgi:hypothetical protein
VEFLFQVQGLSVPLVQEIVWFADLEYDVLDCLKPPYFIPKGSIPIENHAGYNLAQHAKLVEPKWLGLPPDTPNKIVEVLIEKVLDCLAIVDEHDENGSFVYITSRIMDCFKKSPWTIPQGSRTVENCTGFNLARLAKISKSKSIAVPYDTPIIFVRKMVEKLLKKPVVIHTHPWVFVFMPL